MIIIIILIVIIIIIIIMITIIIIIIIIMIIIIIIIIMLAIEGTIFKTRYCRPSTTAEGRKEMFYLTTHSTHFIYGYMASVHCCK